MRGVGRPAPAGVDDVVVDTTVPPWEVDGTVYVRAGRWAWAPPAVLMVSALTARAGRTPPRTPSCPVPAPTCATWCSPVPYHDWANRGPATMRVWIPVA